MAHINCINIDKLIYEMKPPDPISSVPKHMLSELRQVFPRADLLPGNSG